VCVCVCDIGDNDGSILAVVIGTGPQWFIGATDNESSGVCCIP